MQQNNSRMHYTQTQLQLLNKIRNSEENKE
jgi:hypothetical protein